MTRTFLRADDHNTVSDSNERTGDNKAATGLRLLTMLRIQIQTLREHGVADVEIEVENLKRASSSIRRRCASIPIDGLRSRDFDVVEFYKNHEAVSSALGTNLDTTIELAKALPLGLRHEEHRETRMQLARVLAEGKDRLLPVLPELVRNHFAVLNKPGRHDLLIDSCKPFVNDCMELLTGLFLDPKQFDKLSDVFDPGVGFSKRKQLEANTRLLLEEAKRQAAQKDFSNGAYALAIAVMGRDALLGSLVFSLSSHFQHLQGSPLNAHPFPSVPLDTGVPYVWRVGVGSETEGETYECHLAQLVGADDDARLKLFGLGAHTCLGKNHSLKIFESLSCFLAEKTRTLKSVSVSEVKKHVLKIPETFEIELE